LTVKVLRLLKNSHFKSNVLLNGSIHISKSTYFNSFTKQFVDIFSTSLSLGWEKYLFNFPTFSQSQIKSLSLCWSLYYFTNVTFPLLHIFVQLTVYGQLESSFHVSTFGDHKKQIKFLWLFSFYFSALFYSFPARLESMNSLRNESFLFAYFSCT